MEIRADDIRQQTFADRPLDQIEIEVAAGMTDVENDAAKGEQAMLNHLTYTEFCRAVNVHHRDILETRIDKERASLQAANPQV